MFCCIEVPNFSEIEFKKYVQNLFKSRNKGQKNLFAHEILKFESQKVWTQCPGFVKILEKSDSAQTQCEVFLKKEKCFTSV